VRGQMRIEENAKAMCYNIYVDTDSEYRTMKTLMSTQSPDLKSMTKLHLNSVYGKAVTNMNKSYITIMVSGSPVIVFKQHIVSIEKRGDKASIYCSNGETYDPSNKYIDIVKQILD
jgi:hypothetical protein